MVDGFARDGGESCPTCSYQSTFQFALLYIASVPNNLEIRRDPILLQQIPLNEGLYGRFRQAHDLAVGNSL